MVAHGSRSEQSGLRLEAEPFRLSCSHLDFLATPSLGNAKKVFHPEPVFGSMWME